MLFQTAVKGSRPLCQDKVEPFRKPLRPLPARRRETEDFAGYDHEFQPAANRLQLQPRLESCYAAPGVQHRTLGDLRRGRVPAERELDLHGMTVSQSTSYLLRGISLARDDGLRCVRVIHGKGHGSSERGPVLKLKVRDWLRQHPQVLALCPAPPRQGGAGAVLVLLRRRR